MAEDIIARDRIKTGVEVNTWQEAIQAAGQILLDAGSVEYKYVDDMIAAVKELGPYMVIMPGFALAHARPCPEVKRNDISLITLKNPVCFGSENDPVYVVLCISCLDTESHRELLSKVGNALLDESIFDRLPLAKDAEEVQTLLRGE